MKARSLLALPVAQSGVYTGSSRGLRAKPFGRHLPVEGHDEGIYIYLLWGPGRSIHTQFNRPQLYPIHEHIRCHQQRTVRSPLPRLHTYPPWGRFTLEIMSPRWNHPSMLRSPFIVGAHMVRPWSALRKASLSRHYTLPTLPR
jgi:hypothetical protein